MPTLREAVESALLSLEANSLGQQDRPEWGSVVDIAHNLRMALNEHMTPVQGSYDAAATLVDRIRHHVDPVGVVEEALLAAYRLGQEPQTGRLNLDCPVERRDVLLIGARTRRGISLRPPPVSMMEADFTQLSEAPPKKSWWQRLRPSWAKGSV